MQNSPTTKICKLALAVIIWSMPSFLAANESVELTPGVIVDLAEGNIYLMTPESSVEAISIDNGRRLWVSQTAAKPLAKTGNLLVSQAESSEAPQTLNLVVMDTEQEGQVVSTTPFALPAQVRAGIDHGMNSKFSSRAITVGQEAYVSWDYQEFPRQGMIMIQDEEDGTGKRSQGTGPTMTSASSTIKLDLNTGEVSTVEPADLPPAAAIVLTPGTPTAADLDPKQRTSADGRHTLVSERVADDREWEKYEWTIIDNESGDGIGTIRSYLSQAPFVVTQPSTIVIETGPYVRRGEDGMIEEPRSIRAINLETGAEIWNRPVRDPEYRGPFPP